MVYCFSCCWKYHGDTSLLLIAHYQNLYCYFWQWPLAPTSHSVPNKFSLLRENYKTLCVYRLDLPLSRISTQHCTKTGGEDCNPILLEWRPCSVNRALGENGSPWSSWLFPPRVELTFYSQAGMGSIGTQHFQPSIPRVEDPLYRWVLDGTKEKHQSSLLCLLGIKLLQHGVVEDKRCQLPGLPDLKPQPQAGNGRLILRSLLLE